MSAIAFLKRRKTKQLEALVRSVRSRRRLHRYIPADEQFAAAVALNIITERRKRK